MGGVYSTDDGKEGGDNERTGCGGTVPPPYAEISSSFGLLERAAEEGGNDNAAFHLQKARMAFMEARASRPLWQADIRDFPVPKEGRGGQRSGFVLHGSGLVFLIFLQQLCCCIVLAWCTYSSKV